MSNLFLRYKYIGLCCVLGLSACGGSGSNGSNNEPVVVTPPVQEEPTVTPEVCTNQAYSILSASDDGTSDPSYLPENTIDRLTTPESRWSSQGTGKELVLDLGSINTLGALKIKWHDGAERQANFEVETSSDNAIWNSVLEDGFSSGKHSGFELVNLVESEARYIKIIGLGNSENDWNSIVEVEAHSCEDADGLIVDAFPNELGIELIDWYLSVPTDEDNSGTSDSIFETELAAGYTNSEFFYASADGGIVMRSPSYGFKTSTNTSYVRVELREMLRRGNTSHRTQGVNQNNWVFGSASNASQAAAGGVNGELNVTLAVNNVTTTGEDYQIGRLVIGQIHANDDEPIRLYYRKLPGNDKGAIYFAHEPRVEGSDEIYVEMMGSRSNSASNPTDGIALDEVFSYRINVLDNLLTVTIIREGKDDIVASLDMSDSLFDEDGQYQYFKVGVYHLNNSSDPDEYAQATFYEIRNSHEGYGDSE
ncbi:polysaccharide lyase family 7 protein [Paraglaciecola sp. 2405UD69-4]|uniref:polysaccharide lyase family 7 protein n=1 Tax=Paraglaciecola sp. 2405UD69-4 TaxID=3391836 RepID=UPI0039C97388